MKKAICLLLLILLLGCQANDNPLTEELFITTVKTRVDIVKQKISTFKPEEVFLKLDATPVIFPQNDPGDAGELYWKVFKDRLTTNTPQGAQLLNDMNNIVQAIDSITETDRTKITADIFKSSEPLKAAAQKAAELPELADLEQAARRKNMNMVGDYIKVAPDIKDTPAIGLAPLKAYCAALICKALLKEAAGDKAAAEASLQTIVAMGQHFTQDSNYYHYQEGVSIITYGCGWLNIFYSRNSNPPKQTAVDQLGSQATELSQRFKAFAGVDTENTPFNIIDAAGYSDETLPFLVKMAHSEAIPNGFRARAIESLFIGYTFRYIMVQKSGLNPEASQYDPPSDVRIQALQGLTSLPDKALGQMATAGRDALTKMKTQNSGERGKYWQGMAK